MLYIFSNCRTKLKYNLRKLNIQKNDELIFMNTAWLLMENLEYFKQFPNIDLYVRAIYNLDNVFQGYCNNSAGNYLEDVTSKFHNFKHIYGINYDFEKQRHYRVNLVTNETNDITDYVKQYPSKKSPTTGFMLYSMYKDKNPLLVNFFNDNTKKNYFLNSNNKDMYSGHNWKYEKLMLSRAKKVFLW